MITDVTYHNRGKYFIPNTKESSSRFDNTENSFSELENFIINCENELLLSFLSIDQFNEFNTAFPNLEDIGNEKWYNLVNGVDYVYNDVKHRFEGLRGFNKQSLISAYVFCKYLLNDNSYYSTTGVIKTQSKNGGSFDPTQKYISAHLDFINKYQNKTQNNELNYSYIYKNGCIVGIDYYNEGKQDLVVTLETFLKHNESDYEGYSFKYFEVHNSFGF